jgi:hypothetical protein
MPLQTQHDPTSFYSCVCVRAAPSVQKVRLYDKSDCDVDVASSYITLAPNFVKIGRLFRKLSMGLRAGGAPEKRNIYFYPRLRWKV